ncbi:16S rRNA (cytosine(1407)-C(5))-methyltransferase RsmF [Shewanella gelidii]|uniref:Ribosomal RNA small subunit methyltransferase F n=1 Tax=Shewanella gelidii TaxID=1642821 RepID=A0A917JXB0_9GAMM|nr:16S rRNA (cytosine(1407)-C(5))-methyltransferase RsmF [Shewanella gelidii]MCL1099026.1 16S rRNA (cytosine(1407)-C(5))-methyltransferase RsmF [Shewanella gelidii]GGI88725.1 ribosomal RNA small subunit methyltransferase F [Shewanella gelidii]
MVQLNQEFINSIAKELPSHLNLEDFVHYCKQPLRPSIRINSLKISDDAFLKMMQPKGWHFEPIPWCDHGYWITLEKEVQLGNCVEHLAGLFYIQEASSMLPPFAMQTELYNSELVLDVASAPGSKTTQMAAMMQNQGLIIANEYSSSRVKVLHANISRMGVSNCAITHFDGCVFGEYQYQTFDTVLLDAPCSGEGTVRKDPDSLKHWDIQEIEDIANTQKQLIESAFLALKPGGTLVYSTCTLNQLENQNVCRHLKERYGDAVEYVPLNTLFPGAEKACTQEGFLHVWPQIYDSEGFFVAKLRKTASVTRHLTEPKPQKKFPFTPANNKAVVAISEHFSKQLGLELPSDQSVQVRDNEYWLFPKSILPLIGKMRYQRIGLKLAEIAKHGFKTKHEAVTTLPLVSGRGFELNEAQSVEYLKGRDIALDGSSKAKGEIIVCYQGAALGLGKHLGHRIKNNLPRELVKDNVCSS